MNAQGQSATKAISTSPPGPVLTPKRKHIHSSDLHSHKCEIYTELLEEFCMTLATGEPYKKTN